MTETTITFPNAVESCGSRLPYGLCLITNNPCPYVMQSLTWNGPEITCNSSSLQSNTAERWSGRDACFLSMTITFVRMGRGEP